MFLPTEKRGRIRDFASNSGAVASDAPSRRQQNAPDTPPGLRLVSGFTWFGGAPSSCHWKHSARFHKPLLNHTLNYDKI